MHNLAGLVTLGAQAMGLASTADFPLMASTRTTFVCSHEGRPVEEVTVGEDSAVPDHQPAPRTGEPS
ncbi:hypothetical protein GCM10022222_59310 [Amycolatopsis ultiminotia]|uniref:Uncharacterized protein n=1 Tax=Amycolatopsis ultiminotia TaxID=543629 RepID=A0ABP6XKE3_9PSEU